MLLRLLGGRDGAGRLDTGHPSLQQREQLELNHSATWRDGDGISSSVSSCRRVCWAQQCSDSDD